MRRTVHMAMMFAGAAALAACAPKPAPAPPPPAAKPAPAVVYIPSRPIPPNNAANTVLLPARGMDGSFATINRGMTGERAFWQMKIGLNVAAIGCRGPEEPVLVGAYNAFIKTHGKAISANEKKVVAELGKAAGTTGVTERDRLSTKLFNYFAQPPAHDGFCARATELAQVVAATPAAQLIGNAAEQLPQLDQPFVDFYAAYAQYETDVAAWDARYGARAGTPAAPVASMTKP
ncbi:MAG: hypothetical protein RLZZ58_1441 [Pseudomonadota bacterium]